MIRVDLTLDIFGDVDFDAPFLCQLRHGLTKLYYLGAFALASMRPHA